MFASQKIKSVFGMGAVGLLAATALSGCVVSDDPAVNTVATVATVGTAAALFYSISDGYYYDSRYNRLPRGYRPAQHVRVKRIDDMAHYRRQYPLNQRALYRQREENRVL
ncbi:hypothetical protein [Bergeriella denitrificans]|uniref:Lipoprotein n=1 Tax=Bergeriella denitrificans TaxID=494 RepID=A0A378UJ70_BERDE|nr:hypothetical protein [Bergeriella denitrificans]STZ77444.1 Uncharacterised protein [Bergeriella denitrificans]